MVGKEVLIKAYTLMCTAKTMAETYEANRQICRYVHSTSRGHEAIQLATALQLLPCDFVSPYYRDDSLLLGLGFTPYELMLQLLARKDDIFSGGRSYYCHPNYRGPDKPTIIHQSSATGMQVIPATGLAQGIQHLERYLPGKLVSGPAREKPIVICSLGDASITEGEVSEAIQFAVLRQLPIIYLVQDNKWGISVSSAEARAMDAYDYVEGFKGIKRIRVDGSDFQLAFNCMHDVIHDVRTYRGPWLVQASVPLLGHHTSGVRKEFYRSSSDLAEHAQNDPLTRLLGSLREAGISDLLIADIESDCITMVEEQFNRASAAPEPDPATVSTHVFVPTPVTDEVGERRPADAKPVMMVDAGLFAIREIMEQNEEAVFFGQDVGRRLGGVFREAATLAERFGDHRVFNTAIQEAYIIGSTVGLSATGIKPIVEIQFADYIFPGFNQLVTEIAKSCYLSNGKFPVQTLIRIPVGAYGGGGPYHSGCIETLLLAVKGIKIAYPSNAADMKGLMKAAFLDPNPVVMLEHKGLYWSKVPGTENARQPEPGADYILPFGKAAIVLNPDPEAGAKGVTCCIITYGMGVYWALAAASQFPGQVEIVDLRTLFPLDEAMVFKVVQRHGKCMVLTEEQAGNSFAQSLAGRISHQCFRFLDAPVEVIGALDLPAVPMNVGLEAAMLPSPAKVALRIRQLLEY
ncbi:alpha-ketoacid dehydrogenase subunit alpha/beta [Flavitalea antarctica]